ncbi:MAG: bifunctional proline dehydrogenase/L-glutamate gamma-semialdehyde dehydrogenase PutA, partial [Pseudolabrys sp.]
MALATAKKLARDIPPLRAPYAPPDEVIAAELLASASRRSDAEARIDARATRLVKAIRARTGGLGGVEDFLHAYSLSTKEGLALMVLAEALLRVPDAETADRLIEDKLQAGDWARHGSRSAPLLVSASAWTLGLTVKVIHPGETPEGIVDALIKRLGLPAVRAATRQAMRLLGSHFVLGQTIEEALGRAGSHREFLYSFDMLGEGARTSADAEHYLNSYARAIEAIGKTAGNDTLPRRPGISVKLSALHPRFEALSRDRVLAELVPNLLELAQLAKRHELNFTIDAEEADRLELSIDVITATLRDASLAGWDGFGLAVQAYQKRAGPLIDWIGAAAESLNRRLMIRLVKGAYWDTEVKRAQERGLPDYPVFTRKAMTDLCYLDCVRKLLAARPRLYPQFATHNALTVACVIEDAGDTGGYEFQRLHGMGEALYDALLAELPDLSCRVYAPVGGHADLLAYLVRRLLENGANSSFVSVAADPSVPVETILRRPQSWIGDASHARHSHIPLPRDLFGASRRNSSGVEFGDTAALEALAAEVRSAPKFADAKPLIDGSAVTGRERAVNSPIDGAVIGAVQEGDEALVATAMASAQAAFPAWSSTPVAKRAAALERAGDLLEQNRGSLIALLQSEAGKTIDDCVSEVREAVDYCRFYAQDARRMLAPQALPGPTGESNELRMRGRGVFVCISPWNFPLAIFTGQVAAALAAGNAVVAKPAEQTPLVAFETIRLLHRAGIPGGALNLVPGDGKTGALLVADRRVAGVAFTGSTEVARSINRTLAAKDGPIVPLIAETGGVNAMIVDATALPEQVTDDVIASAFRSAGQRCSALRLLCVQEDVAGRVLDMVVGAARELSLGDPRDLATHVGPVIDSEAKNKLDRWIAMMDSRGAVLFHSETNPPAGGTYVAPAILELDSARELKEE